jgi:uncharacterized protein (DUF2141 family)
VSTSFASGGQIDVRISGMDSDEGAARIVVMAGIEGYNGQRPVLLTESVRISEGVATWRAEVPSGTYAIIAHHDKDADDTLNRPVFALPVEPYGYSNGAWTNLGLPTFDEVAFEVGDGANQQHIHLRTNAFVTLAQLSALATVAIAVLFSVLALYRRYNYPTNISS